MVFYMLKFDGLMQKCRRLWEFCRHLLSFNFMTWFYSSAGKYDTQRKISFKKPNPSANLGISLTGGNVTGIFVQNIEANSPASGQNIHTGDQILEVHIILKLSKSYIIWIMLCYVLGLVYYKTACLTAQNHPLPLNSSYLVLNLNCLCWKETETVYHIVIKASSARRLNKCLLSILLQ